MIRYTLREDEILGIIKNAKHFDPQKVGEALALLEHPIDGLDPKAVLVAARSPDHVLHKHIEWDVEKAAEQHHLTQVKQAIRLVKRVDEDAEEGFVPAYVSINRGRGYSYMPVDKVRKSVDLQEALLLQLDREFAALERRASSIREICELAVEARRRIAERLKKRRKKGGDDDQPGA